MSFIALDLGTSFIKGAVLDLDALRLDHIQRVPFPDPLPGLPPSSEDSLLGLLALALAFSGRAPSVQQAMAELANHYLGDVQS